MMVARFLKILSPRETHILFFTTQIIKCSVRLKTVTRQTTNNLLCLQVFKHGLQILPPERQLFVDRTDKTLHANVA